MLPCNKAQEKGDLSEKWLVEARGPALNGPVINAASICT